MQLETLKKTAGNTEELQKEIAKLQAENAPIIENIIAESMGVARGELKGLASEGKITADVIKTAILGSMDKIDAQFETMPKQWGDHFTSLSNFAFKAFDPVFRKIGELANSQEVRTIVNSIKTAITTLVPIFYLAIDGINQFATIAVGAFSYISNVISNNSGVIKSAMAIIGLALLHTSIMFAIYRVQALVAFVTGTAVAIKQAMAFGIATIAANQLNIALVLAAIAQKGLTAAMLACPLSWIGGATSGNRNRFCTRNRNNAIICKFRNNKIQNTGGTRYKDITHLSRFRQKGI